MSVKTLALVLFVQLALCSTTVWAAGRKVSAAPAIEMSETAESAEARQQSTLAPDAGPAEGDASGAEATEATGADAEAPQAEAPAGGQGAPEPATPPYAAADVPVAWWREAASLLGLASDPHPGETAEPAPGRPPLAPDYIMGPGDLLGISVWRDENLTRSVVVLPDGKISFPLAGDLVAGGKTLAQLRRELEGKLARYVTDAGVTVEVKQCNSMFIYTIGRVNVPGRHAMVASTNVLQALAMAGGLNPFARKGEVKVLRRQGGKTTVFPFNYADVSEGRHLETNIELQRGDVVIVP